MTDDADRLFLACSCEDTMPLDRQTLAKGCGGAVRFAEQLCRRQIDLFRALLPEAGDIVVGCTQEAPLFEETAADAGYAGRLAFANIRENGGWSDQAADAGPKMAALLAAAAEPTPPPRVLTLESKGVALIAGHDETAIEVGRKLAASLDVTVLLTGQQPVAPPRVTEFPVVRGRIRSATGALGGFEATLDGFARPSPASRAMLAWGEARDGAVSHCDVIVDLVGGPPLFAAHELRPGYIRADAASPAAVERAIREAADLVGEFDKPRAVDFRADLCAHSRSGKIGCRRCLDLCPTGAISPAGDHVAI
ncbi:MAG: 4Fe-4S ferredoxin, partial [Methylobacteriaceae bacterium]|nr:4Fe-4S ferredoxin [Methylobacteriaceae bacterium]